MQDIRFIRDTVGLSWLDEDLRELAQLRLENEAMSLRELAEMLTVPISRSGVNHRLRRICEKAQALRGKRCFSKRRQTGLNRKGISGWDALFCMDSC